MDIYLQVGDQVPPGLHGQPGQCAARLAMVAPGHDGGTTCEGSNIQSQRCNTASCPGKKQQKVSLTKKGKSHFMVI